MMRLTSGACAATLTELVEKINSPWDGAKLKLVEKKNIPKLTKATFYVKGWGCKFTSKRILDIIGNQNKGLEVDKWEIFHREEDQNGTLFVVGIDRLSLATLAKSKGMAFFVSKAIFFKMGKSLIGGGSETGTTVEAAAPSGQRPEDASVPDSREAGPSITNSQEDRLLEDQ